MKNSVMRMGNITVVGLKAISRNKLRSFLTMLGIVIGVGCVIAVVAIGNGATKSVEATINSLGTNFIMVFPGATTASGARIFTGNSTLTADDGEALARFRPTVVLWMSIWEKSDLVVDGHTVVAGTPQGEKEIMARMDGAPSYHASSTMDLVDNGATQRFAIQETDFAAPNKVHLTQTSVGLTGPVTSETITIGATGWVSAMS